MSPLSCRLLHPLILDGVFKSVSKQPMVWCIQEDILIHLQLPSCNREQRWWENPFFQPRVNLSSEGSGVTDPPLILSYGLMFRTLHSGQSRLKGRPGATATTWPNTRNDGTFIVLFHLFWDKYHYEMFLRDSARISIQIFVGHKLFLAIIRKK